MTIPNFCKNGDFNNFTKNIFTNDLHGQHKRCVMAIPGDLISQLSKIRENKATQKFPSIQELLGLKADLELMQCSDIIVMLRPEVPYKPMTKHIRMYDWKFFLHSYVHHHWFVW